MLAKEESIKLFIFGCIPVRLIIALLPVYIEEKLLPFFSILLFIISFSFFYLYIFNLRQNAFEAGGNTWWANYRIIHAILYITAGVLSLNKNRLAYIPLIIDVIIGTILFVRKRFLLI